MNNRPQNRILHPGGLVAIGGLAILLVLLIAAGSATGAPSADGNVSAYRPEDAAFSGAGEVAAAIENGSIDPANRVVVGETVVLVIDSPRLSADMAAGNGTATERFFAALDGAAGFRIAQTNPSTMVNRRIARVGPRNVTAFRNGSTVYLLIDTGALAFVRNEVGRPAEVNGGERFALEFGYGLPELPLGGHYEPAAPVIELHPTKAELSDLGYRYEVLPPEWVKRTVEVNLPAEESIRVRVSLHESDRTISVPVNPEEVPTSVDVWIDLRAVEAGTGYTLDLIHDDEIVDRYIGTLRTPSATVGNVSLTTVDGQTYVNVTVRLSLGGKVQVLNADCDQLGWVRVPAGERRRFSIDLWQDGQELSLPNTSDFPITVRAVRGAGSPHALYPNESARSTVNWTGDRCGEPDRDTGPTPTVDTPSVLPTTTAGTTPSPPQSVSTPTPDISGPEAVMTTAITTSSPGQSGFTVLLWLGAIVVLIVSTTRVS